METEDWLLLGLLALIPLSIFKIQDVSATAPGAYPCTQQTPEIKNWDSINNRWAPTTPAGTRNIYCQNRNLFQFVSNPFPGGL